MKIKKNKVYFVKGKDLGLRVDHNVIVVKKHLFSNFLIIFTKCCSCCQLFPTVRITKSVIRLNSENDYSNSQNTKPAGFI